MCRLQVSEQYPEERWGGVRASLYISYSHNYSHLGRRLPKNTISLELNKEKKMSIKFVQLTLKLVLKIRLLYFLILKKTYMQANVVSTNKRSQAGVSKVYLALSIWKATATMYTL